MDDSGIEERGENLPEGIYNVPRNTWLMENQVVDPSSVPIARGIYDVPRSLLGQLAANDMSSSHHI